MTDKAEMAADQTFRLVYDGPALAEHRMDVRALAPALLAMGDVIERANELLNGDQARVSVNVHASFREGSFGIEIDLLQSLWQKALSLGHRQDVQSIAVLLALLGFNAKNGIVGVMQVIRWLRGKGVSKIDPVQDGIVRFTIDDEAIEVEERVYELVRDYKLRKAIEGVVATPLADEGIDSVSVVDEAGEKILLHIDRRESRYFRAPQPEDELLESDEYTATLQVLTLAFQDGNKWRFTEGGGNTYYADILDEEFLHRIRANESFAKDDIIRARVRRTQRVTKDGLKAEYEVLHVFEHRSATPHVQMKIGLDPPEA